MAGCYWWWFCWARKRGAALGWMFLVLLCLCRRLLPTRAVQTWSRVRTVRVIHGSCNVQMFINPNWMTQHKKIVNVWNILVQIWWSDDISECLHTPSLPAKVINCCHYKPLSIIGLVNCLPIVYIKMRYVLWVKSEILNHSLIQIRNST